MGCLNAACVNVQQNARYCVNINTVQQYKYSLLKKIWLNVGLIVKKHIHCAASFIWLRELHYAALLIYARYSQGIPVATLFYKSHLWQPGKYEKKVIRT